MSYQNAIAYLAAQQRVNGSFTAWSSKRTAPFVGNRIQPTSFHTILILDCLQKVEGADDIRSNAAEFVGLQVSRRGSWNYWQRQSPASKTEPYPDDFDDTACAIAALFGHGHNAADPSLLARFAQLLTCNESEVGGPYYTWINTGRSKEWLREQVDIAVNANIGYALAYHGVTPSGLRRYIESAIVNNQYRSAYYVGEVATVYFISRWYRGTQQKALSRKIYRLLDESDYSLLHFAMLFTAASHQAVDHPALTPIKGLLQTAVDTNNYPSSALYVDPRYNAEQQYSGSTSLTAAFVLEALAMPSPVQTQKLPLRVESASLNHEPLRQDYEKIKHNLLSSSYGAQIGNAASIVAVAASWAIPQVKLQHLDRAGLEGWIAYSLYDDIVDGSESPKYLPLATIALRKSFEGFITAHHGSDYKQYVSKAFDSMDNANDWELRNARAVRTSSEVIITKLPEYGKYERLAERSLGHSLPAIAVAYVRHESMRHRVVLNFQLFFWHFLIARQLNDDAHDWQHDLRAGHLSAVVCQLLKDYGHRSGRLNYVESLTDLQQCFWRTTIDYVAQDIDKHLDHAHLALQKLTIDIDVSQFESWLQPLRDSAATSVAGRDQALEFVTAYKASYV